MYSKPFACRPFCWRGQVREVLRGDRAASGDRRTPTPRAAVGRTVLLPFREPRQRPDLHQRLLRPQRAEPVGGRAAVHRQHEVVREAVEEREVDALRVELVEVGDVMAPVAVPLHDRVVERAVPRGHRQRRVGRELEVAEALGDAHVVGVHIPSMPSLIARRYWMSASMKACGSNGASVAQPEPRGDDELRVRLHHVVHLDERLDRRASSSPGGGTRTTSRCASTPPSTRRGSWPRARGTAGPAARRRRS